MSSAVVRPAFMCYVLKTTSCFICEQLYNNYVSLHPNLCSPSILVCFSTSTYRSPLTLSGLPDTSVGVVLQCNLLKFIDLQILAVHVHERCIVIMQQAFMHNYIIILINIIIEVINNCTQPYMHNIYIHNQF